MVSALNVKHELSLLAGTLPIPTRFGQTTGTTWRTECGWRPRCESGAVLWFCFPSPVAVSECCCVVFFVFVLYHSSGITNRRADRIPCAPLQAAGHGYAYCVLCILYFVVLFCLPVLGCLTLVCCCLHLQPLYFFSLTHSLPTFSASTAHSQPCISRQVG